MEKVLIIGGGPGGATAAAMLAKAGFAVTVLEKERFPRHHVGESLQPGLLRILDEHLGIGPRLAAQGFAYKFGAVYVWGESREPWSVIFDRRLEAALADGPVSEAELFAGGYEHTWQVDRALFDAVLLDAAREAGAEVRDAEVVAPRVDADGRVVGVTTRDGAELDADFVIDASGQRCLLGRHFDLTVPVEDMRATATYTYYDGAGGVPGVLGRHVQLVVTVDEGWVWFIPISRDRTSVGVVSRERKKLSDERFHALVAAAGLPLEGATQVEPLRYARDWSFTHKQLAGPGWLLLGDAACFIDPILSGGVDFAVRGAADAALALMKVREGAVEADALGEYARNTDRLYRAHLRLARYWYGNNRSVDGFFWEAHKELAADALTTPLRAFVYVTSGRYAADQHFRVFQAWQEKRMFDKLGVDEARLKSALKRRGPR
ncbi:MAG: FAD-dependent oxidoreductase [Deltaproteobacteria bacterium]|nr:MAG: FAD-dependent oxidoreductase [Deltaproteobacteria bacterium]